jgi:hypothetical protein
VKREKNFRASSYSPCAASRAFYGLEEVHNFFFERLFKQSRLACRSLGGVQQSELALGASKKKSAAARHSFNFMFMVKGK